ncbi:hypothetical protein F4779DRAFT_589327 [Xylariaceae sp. FL0662B]|nr:hypothetical protein F4779DRAFT_589327 [Xylariaceae sp. FL0662B]
MTWDRWKYLAKGGFLLSGLVWSGLVRAFGSLLTLQSFYLFIYLSTWFPRESVSHGSRWKDEVFVMSDSGNIINHITGGFLCRSLAAEEKKKAGERERR